MIRYVWLGCEVDFCRNIIMTVLFVDLLSAAF